MKPKDDLDRVRNLEREIVRVDAILTCPQCGFEKQETMPPET